MNAPLKKLEASTQAQAASRPDLFAGVSTGEMLSSTHTDELVIALCGPIGSPLHEVAEKLQEMLQNTFGYHTCNIVRLSRFIESHARRAGRTIPGKPAERRHALIDVGDDMRRNYGYSVLAELAVHDIRVDRELHARDPATSQYLSRRACHIIDSIKNQHELELLRTVYREALHVVGVFAPVGAREQALRAHGLDNTAIAQLMDRDSGEELDEGQTVQETFPQCDFFLRMDSNTDTQLRGRVERFLHLILGTQIITPTRAETAMYAAASAASNSACLSRQVGAAVTDQEGEILAIGWNDVPRAFGDLYVADQDTSTHGNHDLRCWNFGGKCYNDEEKDVLAAHVVDALGSLVSDANREAAIRSVKGDKKLRGLIEFSRSIHAEMHAILTALRQKGDRVRGGRIYVTTYPCHSCARHIIAAGISEVYYIEPYKKSLATRLHGDAMTESEEARDKVRLLPYDGVAPARFLSLFKMKKDSRKREGKVIRMAPDRGTPKVEKSLEALPALEALVVESLRRKSLVASPPGASASDTAGTTPA
ncbi:anti-phage dCTP deaminase [uncultured Hydrogenophaga sp.]|uniref:anti-phage dCTP deaminase n=1 Tax=uncultured Hydrogenophaga sp. TaxID=199683 RepID=UPI002587D4DD|nr:anti-phage dCTP deaminase [uncultured Hydrogenophaga sp.]